VRDTRSQQTPSDDGVRGSHGNVDKVAIDDSDVTQASCGRSTPGGSRQCLTITTATVAMAPPTYDAVVEMSEEGDCSCTVTVLDDQQVRSALVNLHCVEAAWT